MWDVAPLFPIPHSCSTPAKKSPDCGEVGLNGTEWGVILMLKGTSTDMKHSWSMALCLVVTGNSSQRGRHILSSLTQEASNQFVSTKFSLSHSIKRTLAECLANSYHSVKLIPSEYHHLLHCHIHTHQYLSLALLLKSPWKIRNFWQCENWS